MKDRIFAGDGNWLLHRIYHTQRNVDGGSGPAIANRLVALICKDALAVKATRVLVAFDGPNVFRHKLTSSYKSNRNKEEAGEVDLITNKDGLVDGPYIFLEHVRVLLAELGLPCVQKNEYEADDILASVAAQNDDVVLGTKDKDSLQCLRPGVIQYDSSFKLKGEPKPRTLTHKDVESVFGVPASLCVALQTLVGDGIDNIPTIVSRAKAVKGLKEHGSIKKWVDADPAIRKLLSDNMKQLRLNKQLVTLVSDIRVDIPPVKWNPGSDLPLSYIRYREFLNPKSKGLF